MNDHLERSCPKLTGGSSGSKLVKLSLASSISFKLLGFSVRSPLDPFITFKAFIFSSAYGHYSTYRKCVRFLLIFSLIIVQRARGSGALLELKKGCSMALTKSSTQL